MKLVVADTNAFLRFLLNDIPQQVKKFEEILKKAKNLKLYLLFLK